MNRAGITVLFALGLTACGGGGGDSSPPDTTASSFSAPSTISTAPLPPTSTSVVPDELLPPS